MNTKFSKDYPLRASDFDCRSMLQPASILDLFQDIAGLHAQNLGIGHDYMLERELIWVVVKVKYQVLGNPKMYQDVNVETWPLPPTRVGFFREYVIRDVKGSPIVKGTSEWVLMHSEKRRIMRVDDVYPFDTESFCTQQVFDEKLTKVHDFETEYAGSCMIPGFSDLDLNGHVNNTKYANFVLNAINLEPDEIIDTFQIDYHREVTINTALKIFTKRDGKEISVKGMNGEGLKMFSCRIQLK